MQHIDKSIYKGIRQFETSLGEFQFYLDNSSFVKIFKLIKDVWVYSGCINYDGDLSDPATHKDFCLYFENYFDDDDDDDDDDYEDDDDDE